MCRVVVFFLFFKQKTAYEMRISDWSSDVCSSDLEASVLAEYLPTLLFLFVATGIGIALIVIGSLLGPNRPSAEKLSPYECGFAAFEDSRMQFDIRYYLIAIQFIVFDLEHIFQVGRASVRERVCQYV